MKTPLLAVGAFLVAALLAMSPTVTLGTSPQPVIALFPCNCYGAVRVTTARDGSIWVTSQKKRLIARVHPNGTVTSFPITSAGFGFDGGITEGPDGAMWFTERFDGKIGRRAADGTFREWSLASGSNPTAITTGPDGALWFIEQGPDAGSDVKGAPRIGRITTAGVIKEMPLPAGDNGLEDIAVGPGPAHTKVLWFTEQETNVIATIDAAGHVRHFAGLSQYSEPYDIIEGPDGNMWFTEDAEFPDSGRVAKISAAGVVKEYSIGIGGSAPRGLTFGPDGHLWFTDQTSQTIDEMNTAGVVLGTYPTLTAAHSTTPFSITRGPGKTLWFTDLSFGQVGRVTLP